MPKIFTRTRKNAAEALTSRLGQTHSCPYSVRATKDVPILYPQSLLRNSPRGSKPRSSSGHLR